MIKNYEKHDFEYYERLKITSYCHFEFTTFPFDSHNCELTMGSGSTSINYMRILKPTVIYKKFNSKEDPILIESKSVPFEMKARIQSPLEIRNFNRILTRIESSL